MGHRLYHLGGTAGVLAVYASDVCQSHDKVADYSLSALIMIPVI
jgi:hypothetical protein